MIDTELQQHLREIEGKLDSIKKGPTLWRSLLLGTASGTGFVIGSIMIVIIIGWMLSVVGVIPGFSNISNWLNHSVRTVPQMNNVGK